MYWIVYVGLIIYILSLILNAYFVFKHLWPTPSLWRTVVQNGFVGFISLASTVMALELCLNLFFAQPDALNHTLASQNWFQRYWSLNTLGYRDQEWSPELVSGKTKVMVLGDSFVAGHGINDPADRFSDVLGQQLGPGYAVMNLGILGAETKELFRKAQDYPYPPDVLVLSFYVNDIADTATSIGYSQPLFVPHAPPLVEYSHTANFFYWRVVRLEFLEENNNYWDWLRWLYDEKGIWTPYESLLEDVVRFADENNVQLMVVVFPNLLLVEESQPITSKVSEVFTRHGVPVIEVSNLVRDLPPQDRVVNGVDWHPNKHVHRLVADQLYDLMRAE